MMSLRLDASGEYNIVWPVDDKEAILLAQAYIDRESSLPASSRNPAPPLEQVQSAFTEAKSALETAKSGEITRATSAEEYRQAVAEAKPLLREAYDGLCHVYRTNRAQLEDWGLVTKSSSDGVTVYVPKGDLAWVQFLNAYVEKETSLTSGQMTSPSLEQLTSLRAQISLHQKNRDSGKTARKSGNLTLTKATAPLLDLVQISAGVLMATQFGLTVSPDLATWGYKVQQRSSSSPSTAKSDADAGNSASQTTAAAAPVG